MNDFVCDILAQELSNLSYISKAGGCVQELKKPTGEGRYMRIPVVSKFYTSGAEGVTICQEKEDYYDVAPNSEETGIVYFEDLGARIAETNSRYTSWNSQVDLVCWLNMKKIGTDNALGEIQRSLISSLSRRIPNNDKTYQGSIKVSQINPKRPSPFDKYDYDEVQTQHLIYPFDYFSVRLSLKVLAPTNCDVVIAINPAAC